MQLCGLLIAFFASILASTRANVIGIDFASDAFKVAIVQPGTPLEIVTNFQSKRKSPTCITFYRGERHFGADAVALMGRKPELTFAKLYRMIGRTPEHPLVKEITEEHYFPYKIYANETHSQATTLQVAETHYTPEELMAMMLQHVKDMTQNFGGKAIKDCVITVPSSFTQHERNAVYTAAEIADLKVLSLIEENTAAALHYGMDRTFEEPTVVMYYNMGAGSVQVSIVQYSTYAAKEMGKNKTIGQFEVLGKAWDASLGGFNFDVKLAELLADRFNEKWNKKANGKGKDLKDFIQPMTKLRIQAAKVKEILSANNEFPVKMEQLHADVDLSTKVTRGDLETACADLLARLTQPIDKALKMANISIANISAVELLGGGVRMPAVKKTLDSYFTETKVDIGQHLNGDEAMALGAAFRAANLSTAFRVRKVGVSDISSFGVSVRLETLEGVEGDDKTASGGGVFGSLFSSGKKTDDDAATTEGEGKDNDEGKWSKFTSLYPIRSPTPAKTKTVAFQYDKDISCRLEYDSPDSSTSSAADEAGAMLNLLPEGTDQLIAQYNITGVAAFAKETAEKGLGVPKVHLSFGLDSSGLVSLIKAEATVELPVEPEPETEGGADADADADKAEDGDSDNLSGQGGTDAEESDEDKTEEKSNDNEDTSEANADTDTDADANAEEEAQSGEESSADKVQTDSDVDGDEQKDSDEKDSSKKDQKKNKKPNTKDGKKDKKSKETKDKDSKKNKKKDSKKKDNLLRKTLTVTRNRRLPSPAQWSTAQINEARERLQELKEADDLRMAKEAAMNDLEAYIYKVKNQLMDQEDDLKAVSTEEQRQAVVDMANEAEEWLYDEGRDQTVAVYNARQAEIRKAGEAIFKRFSELTKRPAAVTRALGQLKNVTALVSTWEVKMPHITANETEKLLSLVETAEQWIADKVAEQDKLDATETPAFLSSDVAPQLKPVTLMLERLLKKPKPAPPAPEKKNSTDDADAAESSTESIKVELETDEEGNETKISDDDAEETQDTEGGDGAEGAESADDAEKGGKGAKASKKDSVEGEEL